MLAFFSYIIIMAITPGPNNLMAMQESRLRSFRGSYPFLLGLFVSFFILDFFTFLFMNELRSAPTLVLNLLKCIGSIYLVYLIFSLFGYSFQAKHVTSSNGPFWAGMLLNLTNVKVILYFLVGYISFLMPIFKNRQLLILSFGVIMCFITTACNVLWALLGSLFQSWFTDHGKFINAILSVLLIYAIYEMWK